jgi:hypothetical protein
MNQEFHNIEAVKIRLIQQEADYICVTPLPDLSINCFFLGPFEGEIVVWKMTLAVLQDGESPYIEILQGDSGVYPIRVGLPLTVIDESELKKTIIMIRHYKRLSMGNCGFGSSPT